MKSYITRRKSALKCHRVKYERQQGVIDKTNDQAEDEVEHQ